MQRIMVLGDLVQGAIDWLCLICHEAEHRTGCGGESCSPQEVQDEKKEQGTVDHICLSLAQHLSIMSSLLGIYYGIMNG
jgi:hypothetical protein